MGNGETRLVDLRVPIEEQVEIEGARPLGRDTVAAAAEPALHREKHLQQLPRRQGRLEGRRAVEEARLVDVADGIGVEEPRDGDDVDPGRGRQSVDRAEERRLAIAEIRAERDVGTSHAPRLPLRWPPVARRLVIAAAAVVAVCGLTGTAAAATGRISDDPLQSQEWWLHDVGADAATPPGPGIPIAIVDSGLDVTTPEFAGRPNVTLLNDQTVFGPEEWHGTFVASIAAAPANGVGIVGVYPQAALEIWDASAVSSISPFSAAVGIETAAQHCPGVISLSIGSRTPSQQISAAITDAFHRGCLVVASAGNDRAHGSPPTYPADQSHVLTVAATDENDRVTDFSTSSANNDLAAPGIDIIGAVTLAHDPSGYITEPGTSFSAPIVAAAAAWLWTVRPTLDWTQIEEILRSTARDVGAPGFDADTGWGIVNIPAALAAATPPRDPYEPNDDIDEVKPGAMFDDGQPAITTAAKPSTRIAAPSTRTRIRATSTGSGCQRNTSSACPSRRAARPRRESGAPRRSASERLSQARRRDLAGTQITGGKRGFTAYVEVLPTGRSTHASYVLSVKASKS